MRVCIKKKKKEFLFSWGLKSMPPLPYPRKTQRKNCLREPWVGIWKTCEEQFPAELIFVKHHVVWLVWAFLVKSEAGGTQPRSQPPCCERHETGRPVSRWESLLIVWAWTKVWAQNVRHILAGIIITDSNCMRSTEELPREEAELSSDLNHIRTLGSKRKICFPCLSTWKCCFNSFNVIICAFLSMF